jgi:hypothetical protein
MKNKKESIVVFEDWFRYARCLNDAEFREFMSAILNYYKTQEQPKFNGLMLDVWNDIIDDLEKNIQSRQNRRDAVEKNRQKNSKVNKLLTPKPTPTNVPTGRPTISSTIIPTSTPDTNGMVMVDGRLEMEDNEMEDDGLEIDDDKKIGDRKMLHPNPTISQSLKLAGVSSIDEFWND